MTSGHQKWYRKSTLFHVTFKSHGIYQSLPYRFRGPWVRYPSCRPTNSIKALKDEDSVPEWGSMHAARVIMLLL